MDDQQQQQLVEWLLGGSTLPLGRLYNGAVSRAAGRLQEDGGELDHAALTRDLRTVCLLLKKEEGEKDAHGETALKLLQQVCLPYMDILLTDCTARFENIHLVAETLAGVLQDPWLPAETAIQVLSDGVSPLLTREGQGEGERLASFLCSLFSRASPTYLQQIAGCDDQLSAMFPSLLSLLNHAAAPTCHLLLSSLLPLFITSTHRLSSVWTMVQEVWHEQRLVELHPLTFSLAVLCCFSDVFIARDHTSPFCGAFPSGDLSLDVRSEGVLWEVLGAGLRSHDPLDRKRSMYLLDRVLLSVRGEGGDVMSEDGVFWWRRECEGVLSAVWEDVVLLLHTMEEKQIHIIKPVKSRMKNIIQATSTIVDGHSVIHVSWLQLVLERVFVHTEAKSIVRWGVSEALSLELASFHPLLLPQHWKFVYGPLLTTLSDTKLYIRDQQTTPNCPPPMASLFTSFLQNSLSHLPSMLRAEFMHGLLVAVETAKMSETPLLYISHSLSLLHRAPLLTPSSLLVLRSVISQLDTHRPLLRAAVMTFILITAANLSDLSVVGFHEVAVLLGAVRISDCLVFSSPTWRKMCEWVAEVCTVSSTHLSSFLMDSLSSLLDPHSQRAGPGHTSLSLLVLLSVDAQLSGLQCLPAHSSLEQLLSSLLDPLTSVLSSASSRPYLSPHTLTNSLLTLTSLITTFLSGRILPYWQGGESETGKLLYKCLLPWLPDMIQNVQDLCLKGSKDGASISLSHITLLTSSLSSLHTFTTLYGFSWSSGISPTLMANTALCTLHSVLCHDSMVELTPAVMGALSVVGWVCGEDILLPPLTLSTLLDLPLTLTIIRPSSWSGDEYMEWGPLMDWCEAMHWTTMRYCLRHLYRGQYEGFGGGVRASAGAVWQVCEDCMDTVSAKQLPCVLACLSLLLPHVELSLIPATVQTYWRCVQGSLTALPAFLALLLHPNLLFSTNTSVVGLVDQLCEEMMVLGDRRSGIVNAVVVRLCETWSSEGERGGERRVEESLLRHKQLLLQLCCFGSVSHRSIRSLVDGEQFVRLLGDQVAANYASGASCLQGDSNVRATILSFLVGVASRDGSTHFLSELSVTIFQKLSELSAMKPRYFVNSITHRLKQRLLQTFLLLLPHLPPEMDEELGREVMQALQCDNQTSVRHLLEWTAVLLMARQSALISSLLLPALQPESTFRMSRLPSVFAVVYHLSGAGSPRERLRYCVTVLPLILQWTTCHHFVVRLYAQRTLQLVWEACQEVKGEEEEEGEEGEEGGVGRGVYTLIDSCMPLLKKQSDAAKFSHKLEQNIFFSLIHPRTDISVEALFDVLPRLCGMVESECVSVGDFSESWEKWGGREGGVSLYCENSALCDMVRSGGGRREEASGDDTRSIAHKVGGMERGEEGEKEGGGGGEEREEVREDVQKKITRWSSGVGALEELFPGLPQKTRAAGGLIVVASLLNKIPNLGGLCRTCEIFGVSELVVASRNVVDDPLFTGLSVSSQHWIRMSEVRLPQLPSYLLTMRSAGYHLVGAEQTAHSKCITSYTFQPHTILLLGNEREGIPVQLLHLLHECVQIPQLGVVRSLNVHVSGALLIWEYCKQHLLNDTTQHS